MPNIVGINQARFEPAIGGGPFRTPAFWRRVADHASKLLLRDPNLPPKISVVSLETDRDLNSAAAGSQEDVARELGTLLAKKIKKLIPKWRADYLENATEFERRLGIYIVAGQVREANEAASRACEVAVNYIRWSARQLGEYQAAYDALLEKCGYPLKMGWGGSVGQNPRDIEKAFTSGNIRERLAHLDYFIEKLLGEDILNRTAQEVEKAYESAARAGFDVEQLKARRKQVHGDQQVEEVAGKLVKTFKTRRVGSAPHTRQMSTGADLFPGDTQGYKDKRTSFKFDTGDESALGMDMQVWVWAPKIKDNPNLTLRQKLGRLRRRAQYHGMDISDVKGTPAEQIEKLVNRFCGKDPTYTRATRSKESRSALSFKDDQGQEYQADLSAGEQKLLDPSAPDQIPWSMGSYVNVVNKAHAWIRDAKKRGMPIESAISGTANRIMNVAQMMGMGEGQLQGMRAAALGYLINVHAHTFHEIMSGAKGYPGCDYQPGRDAYHRIAPIDETKLRSIAGGKLPDEHELQA